MRYSYRTKLFLGLIVVVVFDLLLASILYISLPGLYLKRSYELFSSLTDINTFTLETTHSANINLDYTVLGINTQKSKVLDSVLVQTYSINPDGNITVVSGADKSVILKNDFPYQMAFLKLLNGKNLSGQNFKISILNKSYVISFTEPFQEFESALLAALTKEVFAEYKNIELKINYNENSKYEIQIYIDKFSRKLTDLKINFYDPAILAFTATIQSQYGETPVTGTAQIEGYSLSEKVIY